MASTTNEAEPEDFNQKVLRISNASQNTDSSCNVSLSSASSLKSIDVNRDILKRRVIQNVDGKAKKRKTFVKKFRKEWMNEPIFRGWLQPIPNISEKCWCSVCNVVLLCGHSELEKHASGKKHSDLILLHQLKGNLMDPSSPPAILDVINMDECKKDENGVNAIELSGVQTLQLPADNPTDSHLVFHVMQDGTLVEMKVEDYEKLVGNTHDQEVSSVKKTPSYSKGTVINVGNTTITKGGVPPKAAPAILRHPSKSQNVKVHNVVPNSTQKSDDEARTTVLLDQYGTDTEDDDYDDDDDFSDSQQMIKEMKAEVAYQEKKLIEQKKKESKLEKLGLNSLDEIKDSSEIVKLIAERELEVRLHHLQEKRRQRFNLYKLRLQEMDARVRAAELELSRSEELHKLRVKHLKLQIMKEENYNHSERFEQGDAI